MSLEQLGHHEGVFIPGSLDGAQSVVLDSEGRQVASCALDDQRFRDETTGAVVGQVLGTFEDAEAVWAESLPRFVELAPAERNPAVITLVFPTDERVEGVR